MPDPTTLSLSADEMRALGYQVVDLLVQHATDLPAKPVTRKASRAAAEALLDEPLPEAPADPQAVVERVARDVMGHIMHLDHPRFFAFVPGPSNFVGALADALASGFNVYTGTWLEGSTPGQVELVALDWLRAICGLPPGAGGLFVSGGSVANLTALAVARHRCLDDRPQGALVYCSDQTHSSVDRALRLLGFAPEQVRRLPSDADFRLDPVALRRAVAADRAGGAGAGRAGTQAPLTFVRDMRPYMVVANAGTTNTGAVDPLEEVAAICRQEELWLHVDGAYGAAAALCDRGKALLAGLGAADSLVLDPHKWLFQPYEIGCVLVRDERWLIDTFRILPEYLTDIVGAAGEVNFCDRGIQLSRGFRALKLWMSLQVFGAAAFRAAQEHGFALAEAAEEAVHALGGDWEVVTPAQMAVVTFRCAPAGLDEPGRDALNRGLAAALVADGYAMISTTILRGRTVLRMCTVNPRATAAEVRETVRRLAAARAQKNPV